MSSWPDAPGTAPLPQPLESALASHSVSMIEGVTFGLSAIGDLDRHSVDSGSGALGVHTVLGSADPIESFSAFSSADPIETFATPAVSDVNALPGATAIDSDDDLTVQHVDGDQGHVSMSDALDWSFGEGREGAVAFDDYSAGTPDRNVDWLLDLGTKEATVRTLCTDRLAEDSQSGSSGKGSKLPGLGFDHSSWMLDVAQPKFFWETDPFLSTIFGQGDLAGPSLKRPAVDIDLTSQGPEDVLSMLKRPKEMRVSGFCEQVIKHVELRDEVDKRRSVISDWSSLVCINLDAFSIGDAIAAGGEGVTHAAVEASLSACFSRKATSTLSKRFYALNRFVNFCIRNGLQFFPLREHVVFVFLQSLVDDEKAAASSGRSFLEACRFAKAMLGLRGDLAELGTSRVDGLAVELGKRAGPIVQASPLLVSQVIALEKLVATTPDMKDRVVYGAMLILVYACGRHSDAQRAVNILLDVDRSAIDPNSIECPGFLELQVLGNKGARSDILRRTYLPLVAPVFTLGSVAWFQSWLQARESMGLEVNGKLTSPLLCRFGADGKPLPQEVTSSECGKLLRKALRIDESSGSAVRSHSLKSTALSWAGKFGVPLETRRLLGHHLDANAKSAEACNRDSMGPAVEKLVDTLKAIKQGVFRPDETRSGRFCRVAETSGDVEPSDMAGAQSESESDSSFVPSSDDSSDSDDDLFGKPSDSSLLWHLVVPELRPGFIEIPESFTVYRNNISGMQHLKQNGQLRFLCGRRECDRYTYCAGKPVKGVAICEHCIGSRELSELQMK
eukprot:s1071_g13.t1